MEKKDILKKTKKNNYNLGLNFIEKKFKAEKSCIDVLFVSSTSSNSWQIRAEQVSAMRTNWKSLNYPTINDLEKADLICITKKCSDELLNVIKSLKKPFVYDIVDCWAQPSDNLIYKNLEESKLFFKKVFTRINANGYIFATSQMEKHLSSLTPDCTTIYHHFRPELKINPIRPDVNIVGYDGANYLGQWSTILERVCDSLNVKFSNQIKNYFDLDVVIIARGDPHDSFLTRNYKSNVKLANAYGSGTPAIVGINEISAHNTDSGDVLFFSDEQSLKHNLKNLIDNYPLRLKMHKKFIEYSKHYDIRNVTNMYESYFLQILNKYKSFYK